MINHASMLLDKSIFVEELGSLLEELKKMAASEKNGPRILLTGSTLAMGDQVILDLIEEAGGTVVIEDFAEGIKPYWTNVKTTGDLMKALADAYFMDRVVPAWFRPGIERQAYLIQMAKDFNVSGIIWYHLMYREAYKLESYYFPEIIKKETGLSMLTLESDYDPSETGQIRTRVETYIDSIRDNMCQNAVGTGGKQEKDSYHKPEAAHSNCLAQREVRRRIIFFRFHTRTIL